MWRWSQLKWTKVIKLLEISYFSLKLLQELPLLDHSHTFGCSEEQAKTLATMDIVTFSHPSNHFLLTPLGEWDTTHLSAQPLQFYILAIVQTPKSVHVMPGNPTSSTGAKESGIIIHYTIFNIFTPLTSGILPKTEYCYSDNSCFKLFISALHSGTAVSSRTAHHAPATTEWQNISLPIIICHLTSSPPS